MALALTIAGLDKLTGYYVPGSLSVARQVKGRSTAAFVMRDPAQVFRPTRGTAVHVTDGGVTFDGTIDNFQELRDGNIDKLRFRVACQDFGAAFDRRFVTRRYPAGSLVANIFTDINTNFLDGEGFNVANVDGSFVLLDALEFNVRSVTECFNTLTELSGEQWWTQGHDIYLKSLANSPAAAFGLTDSSANWTDLSIDYPRSTFYRNVQYLRTAVPLATGSRTENFTGDGANTTFITLFALTSAPTVTVGGVPQAVVEQAAYVGVGYKWIRGGHGVFASTAPGAAVAVVVVYGGYSSNVIVVRNQAEIDARAAIEGNSGKYEALDEAPDVDNLVLATAIADGILAKFSTFPTIIRYRTPQGGLNVGDKQSVNLPVHSINANFYVTDIQSQAIPAVTGFPNGAGSGKVFWHTVTLSSTQDQGNWVKWWIALWSRVKAGRGGAGGLGGATDSSTINSHTLSASTTQITGPTPAENAILFKIIVQDGTGGRQITWSSDFDSATTVEISTGAGKRSIFQFFGSGGKWVPSGTPFLEA